MEIAGGITEAKKICDMACVHDVGVQIHVCGRPTSQATIPNFCIHERHASALKKNCWQSCKYDYQPANGFFEIPEKPGIGQKMTEEEMKNAKRVAIK